MTFVFYQACARELMSMLPGEVRQLLNMAAMSIRAGGVWHALTRLSPSQLGCRPSLVRRTPCLSRSSFWSGTGYVSLTSQGNLPQTSYSKKLCGKATGVGGGMAEDTQKREQLKQDREVLVQHVLVKEDQLQLLVEIQRRLMEGEDFSVLASEHSLCPSKSQGGMLGWIQKGRTVPEFEDAVFSAELNRIVRVKTKHGWHLVEVLEERPVSFLREIAPGELASKLKETPSEDVQLIDVREPNEVAIASVDGFKVYPLSQFGTWAPTITKELDPAKDTYVLCHHGVRSMQAAQWLKSQGFRRLYNISGGIHAYSLQVDSSIPTY